MMQEHMRQDLFSLKAEVEQLHLLYAQTFGVEFPSTVPPPLVLPAILVSSLPV